MLEPAEGKANSINLYVRRGFLAVKDLFTVSVKNEE